MNTCPVCGGKLVWRKKNRVCLKCHRHFALDDSEITCPACSRCGKRTTSNGFTKAGLKRYRCVECGYQSAMDSTSQVVIERERVCCGICGGKLVKCGFSRHNGRQLWFCRDCNMQSADMPTKKQSSMESDSPGGHSFFDGYTVVGYEPSTYCNKKTPCSACKYLLRCQEKLFSDSEQMLCEAMFLVQTGGETMRL